ncbi:stage II sporulation protein M [Asanoa sp. WMMD1127]|uniref:stage II sporulation protein M n=1 Tax=Asanoa sp. WMMD1127 TaxID=3016107 RepID=UPI0024172272|nr:stage II sporulation protein M [Asanoa sp. WMMD1127]MDG4820914.1 stage II sporulation protein M [Asanoa sp. WMMD1127]
MDLDAYVAEHSAQWRRLEQLSGKRRLTAAEVDELVTLYQRTATHLSVVRSRTPDPALIARLSRLVLAGRAAISPGPRMRLADVGRFFTVGFPLAAYRAWPWWSAVATGFTALSFFLMYYTAAHPEVASALIGDEAARRLVETEFAAYYSEYSPQTFAFSLWTHNAWLSVQCLASGVLILPVLWLLWNNALNIGLSGGVMIQYGEADQFFSLITPHGLLELTGVYVAAGVGLRIAGAWIRPPRHLSRTRSVATAGREGLLVAIGLVGLFAVSGVIEAFVTPSPLPPALKIAIGALAWLGFLGYVVLFGSSAAQAARVRAAAEEAAARAAVLGERTVELAILDSGPSGARPSLPPDHGPVPGGPVPAGSAAARPN